MSPKKNDTESRRKRRRRRSVSSSSSPATTLSLSNRLTSRDIMYGIVEPSDNGILSHFLLPESCYSLRFVYCDGDRDFSLAISSSRPNAIVLPEDAVPAGEKKISNGDGRRRDDRATEKFRIWTIPRSSERTLDLSEPSTAVDLNATYRLFYLHKIVYFENFTSCTNRSLAICQRLRDFVQL